MEEEEEEEGSKVKKRSIPTQQSTKLCAKAASRARTATSLCCVTGARQVTTSHVQIRRCRQSRGAGGYVPRAGSTMRKVDSWEVTRRWRSSRRLSALPVL